MEIIKTQRQKEKITINQRTKTIHIIWKLWKYEPQERKLSKIWRTDQSKGCWNGWLENQELDPLSQKPAQSKFWSFSNRSKHRIEALRGWMQWLQHESNHRNQVQMYWVPNFQFLLFLWRKNWARAQSLENEESWWNIWEKLQAQRIVESWKTFVPWKETSRNFIWVRARKKSPQTQARQRKRPIWQWRRLYGAQNQQTNVQAQSCVWITRELQRVHPKILIIEAKRTPWSLRLGKQRQSRRFPSQERLNEKDQTRCFLWLPRRRVQLSCQNLSKT